MAQGTALGSLLSESMVSFLCELTVDKVRANQPFSQGAPSLRAPCVYPHLCHLVPQDSVWGMNHSALHSVFQTNQSNNQQSNFEAVQSGKKKKKQKMVRADPSLLGEHRSKASARRRGNAGYSSYMSPVVGCFS